jgi:dipeptidyl aminopeptidase/acylaminoacyl peptidase
MADSLRVAFATILFCASSTILAASQPLEHFARRPKIQGVSMSPDGRYVAFLSGANDDLVLMTFDLSQAGTAFKRVAAPESGKFDIGWCRWASQRRLLCGLHGNIRGSKYAELPFKRMFAVNADGTALKTLEQERDVANMFVAKTSVRNFSMHEGGGASGINKGSQPHNYASWHMSDNNGFGSGGGFSGSYSGERQDELFDLTSEDPDSVLIQLDADRDSFNEVYVLNIHNGSRSVRIEEDPPIRRFLSDSRGNARLGWGTQDLKRTYFARLDGDRQWRLLAATEAFGVTDQLYPIAMAAEANTAYAVGPHDGRDSLWSIDLSDQRQPQLLFHHALVDVGEPILRNDGRLLGVRYDVERPYVWYADPRMRDVIDRLDRQFPRRVHDVIDSSEDLKTLIVQSSADTDQGTYYLYDVETQKMRHIGASYPELDQRMLGAMSYITYKAADGTEIPSYLTVPSGVEAKNLPLVVMPHDGPVARDTWKFSFLRAFLANRGYAVLQMNYRGSSGFGRKWQLDAHQQWAGLSYSDINDATRWAVSSGIADPKRVCIMGWGFGGYAALLAAARDGGTYRCAISIAGITDLEMYQEHGSLSGEEDLRRAQIGTDREKLKRDSPVANAAQINVPVLLVHGTKDWRVQVNHTRAMAKALDKQRKPNREVIIENGSHELERQSDRLLLLKEIETFLLSHLGAGAKADPEPGKLVDDAPRAMRGGRSIQSR